MSTIDQAPLETLLRFMLDQQPNYVRESMINISVLTWFNLEILQNAAAEFIAEGQSEKTLRDILNLGLAQPFQGLGYSYHDDIRRILLKYLEENPDRMLDVYRRSIDYLHYKVESVDASMKNTLRRELANRLINLGQAYLQKPDSHSAVDVYLEAIELFRELDNILMVESLLIELGKKLADKRDWENADIVYKKLLNPETFNRFIIEESVQRERANYCFEKAEWHAGQQKWSEAFDLYTQAKALYSRIGDLVSANNIIKIIQELELQTKIPLSEETSPQVEEELYPPDDEKTEDIDEIELELKEIEAKMRTAWIPMT